MAVNLPKARTRQLLVNELGDETIVVDLDNQKAHALNPLTAAVWRLCDGKNSIRTIRLRVQEELSASLDDEIVELAFEELNHAQLLDEPWVKPAEGPTRREVMRRLGKAAAIAAPFVTTIVVPTPAQAGTNPAPIT